MSDKILIGFCEESITPDKSIALRGQFYERISEYVETPLNATAMAVKTDSDQLILISCDLTGIQDCLIDGVRNALKGYKDLDPQKVVVNATHTHTSHTYLDDRHVPISDAVSFLKKYSNGKDYKKLVGDRQPEMTAADSLKFLIEHISTAAKKAWDNLHPAYYQFGFGRAAVGMCRRVTYDDGSAQMWGDVNTANFVAMEGGNDSGIEMAFIFDSNKKLEGIVANVCCPSQILEHKSFISSDFWGKAKHILRERFGEELKLVTLCGAAGDQCPRDLVRWVGADTPINDPNIKRPGLIERRADPSMFEIKGTWKAGKRIAREIIDAYEELPENGEMSDAPILEHRVVKANLPFRRVTMKERDDAERAIKDFFRDFEGDYLNYEDKARMHVYAGILARFEDQQRIDIYPAELHLIRFGDIAIATSPFELFMDYGNQIRARSKAKQTMNVELCCGGYGYLPTEKAEKGGHYSAYVTSGVVGHEGGELLVRESVKNINEMFRK